MNNRDLQVSNSLALSPSENRGLQLTSLRDMRDFAQIVVDSGLAPKSFSTPQQVIVALAAGAELGISPMQSLQGLSVVQGKIGVMGDLGLALCESQGLVDDKETVYEGDGESLICRFKVKRKGREWKHYSFSVKEAKAAGIYERSAIWKGYPKRMTYYRCLGFALRDEFSDVMKGLTLKEELDDYLDHAKKGIAHAKPARVAEPERVAEAESVDAPESNPPPEEPKRQTVQGLLSDYAFAERKDGYHFRAMLTVPEGSHYWLATGQPHLGHKLELLNNQQVKAGIVPGPYPGRQDVVEVLGVDAHSAVAARAKAKANHEGPDDLHRELTDAEVVQLDKLMVEDEVREGLLLKVLQDPERLGWDKSNVETVNGLRAGVVRTVLNHWTAVVSAVRDLENGKAPAPVSDDEPQTVEVGVEE